MEKPRGTYDPGWNDPPTFSYDSLKNPSKRGTLLNKRVAFPLSSNPMTTSTKSTNLQDINLPPVILNPSQPPIENSSLLSKNDSAHTELEFSKDKIVQNLFKNFEEVLKSTSDIVKDNNEEIRKRLDILKKMADEEKLPHPVYSKLLELSEALKEGKGDVADNIHIGLMVDYVSQCSQWMPGIRYLIHHVKSQVNSKNSVADSIETSPQI